MAHKYYLLRNIYHSLHKHVLGGKAEGVYLSVPSILGANGVEAIVAPEYSKEDTEAVLKSAETLRENCAKVQF